MCLLHVHVCMQQVQGSILVFLFCRCSLVGRDKGQFASPEVCMQHLPPPAKKVVKSSCKASFQVGTDLKKIREQGSDENIQEDCSTRAFSRQKCLGGEGACINRDLNLVGWADVAFGLYRRSYSQFQGQQMHCNVCQLPAMND